MAFNNMDGGPPRKIKMASGIKSALNSPEYTSQRTVGGNPFENDQYTTWKPEPTHPRSPFSPFDQAPLHPSTYSHHQYPPQRQLPAHPQIPLSNSQGPSPAHINRSHQHPSNHMRHHSHSQTVAGMRDAGGIESQTASASIASSKRLDMTDTRDSTSHSRKEQKYSILNSMNKTVGFGYSGSCRQA